MKWESGWISGKIVRPHPHNTTVLIDYEDGDQIWTQLSEEHFRILGQPQIEYTPDSGFRIITESAENQHQSVPQLVEQLGSLLGHPTRDEVQHALSLTENRIPDAIEYLKLARQTKESDAQQLISSNPAGLVNYQVSVKWRAGQWYLGYISCYDIMSGLFYVHYNDGDEEWVDLSRYQVVLLNSVPLAAVAPPELTNVNLTNQTSPTVPEISPGNTNT